VSDLPRVDGAAAHVSDSGTFGAFDQIIVERK